MECGDNEPANAGEAAPLSPRPALNFGTLAERTDKQPGMTGTQHTAGPYAGNRALGLGPGGPGDFHAGVHLHGKGQCGGEA